MLVVFVGMLHKAYCVACCVMGFDKGAKAHLLSIVKRRDIGLNSVSVNLHKYPEIQIDELLGGCFSVGWSSSVLLVSGKCVLPALVLRNGRWLRCD